MQILTCFTQFWGLIQNYSKKCLTKSIRQQSGHKMRQFTSDHYVCQLKRGRALSRPDSTTTREYIDNFSNTFCCIYQASMSQYASQLAKRLAKM